MKVPLLVCAPALLLAAGGVATDYSAARTLRCSIDTSLEVETTVFRMERDGEPVGGPGGGGGASLEQRTLVETFRALEHDGGAPTKARRAFETVQRKTTSEMGGELSENEEEGPLHGVTLELALADGAVEVEVVDGSRPEQEAALKGHALALEWDGLLPPGDAAVDESWELESAAILRALALDLDGAYFPRAEPADGGSGAQGGGDGSRRSWSGRRPSALRSLATAEWQGKATLKGEVEHDGMACLEIGLVLEADGEMEAFSSGGGPPRGGRALATPDAGPLVENTIEARLQGRLLFAKAARHPVLLELEGEVSTVRESEFERGESKMTSHTEQEGTFNLLARIAVEEEE